MNEHEYQEAIHDVIYLAGCAVNDTIPDANRVCSMNLENLYRAANRHLLTAITAMALEVAGIRDGAFTQAKGKAIRKVTAMDADMIELFNRFDRMGIWYMPLKGSVLKDYYPAYGMRQMSDHDILFDSSRADDVKSIMKSMGFSCKSFGTGVHDTYHKEPVSNFEMHRALFAPASGDRLCDYYLNTKDRLVKDEGTGYGYHFSSEDFYIYMIAHEYKHYSVGGTGLRSLLDTYVYISKCGDKLDWKYITSEVQKLGIADFERQNRSLALHLFSNTALTDAEQEMLSYIISSGTYGTVEHSVENAIRKAGSKGRYLVSRLFLPMEIVKTCYPFFYWHKVFLPMLCLYRIGRALTVSWKRTRKELRVLMKGIQ